LPLYRLSNERGRGPNRGNGLCERSTGDKVHGATAPFSSGRRKHSPLSESALNILMSGTHDDAPPPTILLVDDEQSVRAIVVKILRRAKYNVLEAESGEAALKISDAHQGKIDLVITDMFMPGLRGPEVVKSLAPRRPGLRALFMSGYTDQDSRSGVPAGANFLHKPFSGKELTTAVEGVLKGPPIS
jgi:two-component system, cell cycle sensor histidine kinase and response regulator CckA